MSILGRTVSPGIVAALAALLVVSALLPATSAPTTHEISLVARDMAFYREGDVDSPNPVLEVKAGERVVLRLRNEDRGITHDFAIPALKTAMAGLSWNEQGALHFSAPHAAGLYEYVCRPHLPMMKGLLRVVP